MSIFNLIYLINILLRYWPRTVTVWYLVSCMVIWTSKYFSNLIKCTVIMLAFDHNLIWTWKTINHIACKWSGYRYSVLIHIYAKTAMRSLYYSGFRWEKFLYTKGYVSVCNSKNITLILSFSERIWFPWIFLLCFDGNC